jgi:autophagy-related protein 2
MAYFLPSYIQKRALRYALTYLDFLETDDLDLDKLGVTMGRRNVIELKDVGFRIKVRWYQNTPTTAALEGHSILST